jgi:DNA repair protein RadD
VKLREYQSRVIDMTRASYARGRRAPAVVLPTGAGKTVVAAEIIRSSVERGNPVLFLAHRAELIHQSVRKLMAAGVHDVRVIQAASDLGNRTAPVAVASIPTLTKWSERMPKASLVIFDECHHAVASTWASIANRYGDAKLLGLTATPQRGDGKPIGDIFDDLVVGVTMRELVELGHLVPCRVWSPPVNSLDAGELAISPVDAYRAHGNDGQAVIFCSNREHAERVAQEMTDGGYPTGVVHGSLASKERSETLAKLERGALRAVANVFVLTEGWDSPTVSVCILARKPQHAGTYLQMVGRVLRPAPGKDFATLLDLGGASLEHGPPEMDRVFTLDGKGISKVERENIRQCHACGAVFLAAGQSSCPTCGITFPRRAFAEPVVANVGLVERTGEVVDQLLQNLRAAAQRTKRSDQWVAKAHAAIGGVR